MPWYGTDLTKLRVLAGLDPADASRDADLTAAADTALSAVETYLDRKLEKSLDRERFFYQRGAILLRRWPLDSAVGVQIGYDDDNGASGPVYDVPNNRIDYEHGILFARGTPPFGNVEINVGYQGGFDPIPNDLLWCLYQAFDAYWYGSNGWGGSAGSSSSGSGEIKKVSLVGIGAVDYDVTNSSSSSSGGGSFDPWSLIPDTAMAILSRYRRESVVGVG